MITVQQIHSMARVVLECGSDRDVADLSEALVKYHRGLYSLVDLGYVVAELAEDALTGTESWERTRLAVYYLFG